MAEQLLAKLKIKPIPKVKETLEIKVKKPAIDKEDVIIKTKIVDKTSEDLVDRNEFLLAIKESRGEKSGKKKITITKKFILHRICHANCLW